MFETRNAFVVRRAAYTHMHAVLMHSTLVYRCSSLSMIVLAFATVDRRPLWIELAAGPFHTSFDERRGAVYLPTIASPHDELVEEPVCELVCSGAKMCEQHEPPARCVVAAVIDHRIEPVIHGNVGPVVCTPHPLRSICRCTGRQTIRATRCTTAPRPRTIFASRIRPSTTSTVDWASTITCIRSTLGGRRVGDDDGLRRSIDPLGCRILPSQHATRNGDGRDCRCGVRRCCRINSHIKAVDDRTPTAM